MATLRWNNCLNWMKAGILYADRVSTVSPSYAHEIMTGQFGCNLDQILRMESGKVSGIVNGIDADLYNPETDPLLTYHFSLQIFQVKQLKNEIFKNVVGLPVRDDVPLFGIVSRLTRQKGFDVVVEESAPYLCKMMFRLFFSVQEILALKVLCLVCSNLPRQTFSEYHI